MNESLVRLDLYFDGKIVKPGASIKLKNRWGTYTYVGMYVDMDSRVEFIHCVSHRDGRHVRCNPGLMIGSITKRSRKNKD